MTIKRQQRLTAVVKLRSPSRFSEFLALILQRILTLKLLRFSKGKVTYGFICDAFDDVCRSSLYIYHTVCRFSAAPADVPLLIIANFQ
jgi:hypothetical protein